MTYDRAESVDGAEPYSHLSANGGERDVASAESVAREPRGCYGAETHLRGGPGLEGRTSCELYKKTPYK